MDLSALKMFVAVAQRGSFAAVAREYDADPSTVSRTIANLEEELGLRLFQRTTRMVSLTESGEVYRSHIEPLLEDIEIALDEAHAVGALPKGTVRITASMAFGQFCLTPLLPRMRERFPELRIELVLTDNPLDLVAERIDLAVRLGNRAGGNFVSDRLFDNKYRVCASPAYLAKHGPVRHPQDLVSHRCLMMRSGAPENVWVARGKDGSVEEIPVSGDIVISSVMALRDCALEGLGPVMLIDWMVREDIRSGQLIELLPDHEISGAHARTSAWLIYPSARYLPLKTRVAIEFLREGLAHFGVDPIGTQD